MRALVRVLVASCIVLFQTHESLASTIYPSIVTRIGEDFYQNSWGHTIVRTRQCREDVVSEPVTLRIDSDDGPTVGQITFSNMRECDIAGLYGSIGYLDAGAYPTTISVESSGFYSDDVQGLLVRGQGDMCPVTRFNSGSFVLATGGSTYRGGMPFGTINFADVAPGSCSLIGVFSWMRAAERNPPTHRLMIEKVGTGSGTVTSWPIGVAIVCGPTCSADVYSGMAVTLYAAPSEGSTFSGWSGDCAGTGPCTLTMDSDKANVTAIFGQPASATSNFTALWWNPKEPGWGLNLNHQGDILFATLFTYDSAGAPMWLVMSSGALQLDGATYFGTLYRTTGPAFDASPFTPIGDANMVTVGTMTLRFPDTESAILTYSYDGTFVTKGVYRQRFMYRAANCTPTTGSRSSLRNYQDLWWKADESGWGINLTHQADTIFATLFTYDATGKGLWLVMSDGARQADGSYAGTLYQAFGPPFNASPFTGFAVLNVGTMSLRFRDGNSGTLAYNFKGSAVTKQITRQVFSSPVPACN